MNIHLALNVMSGVAAFFCLVFSVRFFAAVDTTYSESNKKKFARTGFCLVILCIILTGLAAL